MRIRVISVPTTSEPVKDAVILVESTQSASQVVVHRVGLDWLGLHVHIPHLKGGGQTGIGQFEYTAHSMNISKCARLGMAGIQF